MLYPKLTGLENLDSFSRLSGHRYCAAELARFLDRCGLPAEAGPRRLATYSKGMRQKVGLAIALAKNAKALLLDEPTSGLDPQASHEFSAVLADLARGGVAVLMATYDLFRVKETGTLPLLLSCPVPLVRFLAVRILLRAALFIGAVLAAMHLGLIAVGFDAAAPGATARLALYLALTTAYLGFWFALAFVVDARGGSSASHALLLAGAWLVLVVLMPAGLDLVVKQLTPLPSRIAFVDSVRAASDESARNAAELVKDFYHDHPELAPGATRRAEVGSRRLAVNQATEAAVEAEPRRFTERAESQQALIEDLRFLSPAIVLQQAANILSGNDRNRHRKFMAAVEAHRAELRAFFEPAFVSDAAFTRFDEVPAFRFRDASVDASLEAAAIAAATLVVPTALLILCGAASLRRLPLEP